jgi:hypothetical protein
MDIFSKWLNPAATSRNIAVSFEEVKRAIQEKTLLINTLSKEEQDVLIFSTIPADQEEATINADLENYELANRPILLYGKNAADDSPDKKYKQLIALGCKNVSIYRGGLFEWLLLQDIYGFSHFPTTRKITDLLKYK